MKIGDGASLAFDTTPLTTDKFDITTDNQGNYTLTAKADYQQTHFALSPSVSYKNSLSAPTTVDIPVTISWGSNQKSLTAPLKVKPAPAATEDEKYPDIKYTCLGIDPATSTVGYALFLNYKKVPLSNLNIDLQFNGNQVFDKDSSNHNLIMAYDVADDEMVDANGQPLGANANFAHYDANVSAALMQHSADKADSTGASLKFQQNGPLDINGTNYSKQPLYIYIRTKIPKNTDPATISSKLNVSGDGIRSRSLSVKPAKSGNSASSGAHGEQDATTIVNKKTVKGTWTVEYVDESGRNLLPDTIKDFNSFEYAGDTKDTRTGEIITYGMWNYSQHTFDNINVPLVKGYVAGKSTVTGVSVTPDAPEANSKVVYHRVGKIIPVDENQTPIPGAPKPKYKNDPHDPTKVVPNEPTPTVPGYHLKVSSQFVITPDDPTKDTQVVYVRDGQPTPAQAKITYIDDTVHHDLTSFPANGHVNETISFEKDPQFMINSFVTNGYRLVSNNFESGEKYNSDNAKNIFEVHFKHQIDHIDVNHPGDYEKKKLQKTITRTIKYVDQDGHTLFPSHTDTVTFEATGNYDRVINHLVKLDNQGNIQPGGLEWHDSPASMFIAVPHPSKENYKITSMTDNAGAIYNQGRPTLTAVPGAKVLPSDSNVNIKIVYTKQNATPPDRPTQPSGEPTQPPHSSQPSGEPTQPPHSSQPSDQPTQPPHSSQPSDQPTQPPHSSQPSDQPTQPTNAPSQPSDQPTQPTNAPSQPSDQPTQPTNAPSQPSDQPTQPTNAPSQPSDQPTQPTNAPSQPSDQPTQPTNAPSQPSDQPTQPTNEPSQPSDQPTQPTNAPSQPSDQQPSTPEIPNNPGQPTNPTQLATPSTPTEQETSKHTDHSTTLPQTGRENSKLAAVTGVSLLGILAAGLGLNKKRRRN